MALDRRTFLQFFGIGATVVPLVGDTLDTDNAAKLVTPPDVLPVELPTRRLVLAREMPPHYPIASEPVRITMSHSAFGRYEFDADFTSLRAQPSLVDSLSERQHRRFMPSQVEAMELSIKATIREKNISIQALASTMPSAFPKRE